jgi:hypothetical protein
MVRCCGLVDEFLGGFKNIKFRTKNIKVLAFGFTEKRLVVAKTSQKIIFLGHEFHITARLDVAAL